MALLVALMSSPPALGVGDSECFLICMMVVVLLNIVGSSAHFFLCYGCDIRSLNLLSLVLVPKTHN
jgi:hypothetical protein